MSATLRAAVGTLLLTLLGVAVGACGTEPADEDAPTGPSPTPGATTNPSATPAVGSSEVLRDLTDRAVGGLPPDRLTAEVTAVDLAAARASAGVPADADPLAAGPDDLRVFADAGMALGDLASPSSVLAEDLDPGAVSAAVTLTSGSGELTVVRTAQDTDALRTALLERGYADSEGVLAPPTADAGTTAYVAVGAGLVAWTPGPDGAARGAVLAAVTPDDPQPSGPGDLVAAVGEASGAAGVRLLDIGEAGSDGPWRCLDALATADPFTGTAGHLVFVPARAPEGVEPVLQESGAGTPWAGWRFGEPEVRDGWWWVPVDLTGSPSPWDLLAFTDQGGAGEQLVRCR